MTYVEAVSRLAAAANDWRERAEQRRKLVMDELAVVYAEFSSLSEPAVAAPAITIDDDTPLTRCLCCNALYGTSARNAVYSGLKRIRAGCGCWGVGEDCIGGRRTTHPADVFYSAGCASSLLAQCYACRQQSS